MIIRRMRVIIIAVLLATLMVPVSASAEKDPIGDLNEVFQLLENYHISGVEADKLVTDAIEGMIAGLDDPYTVYYTADEWEEYEGATNQDYVGVGMRLTEDTKGVYVVEVFANSPAETAGILKGDYITAVDGQNADGLAMQDLIQFILGPEGTKVSITVQRGEETLTLECVRAQIHLSAVYSQWFDGGIGYIELNNFSENADVEFIKALSEWQDKEVNGLIIDLRGNPGGYLHTVSNIAEQFIEEGILINTRDRYETSGAYEIVDGKSVNFPVVVMVNEDSASGAEILAGALQDYDIATIVGKNTYGKGSVQRLVPLSSDSVLKLTIEEYLTPLHHPVNNVGIKPDIEVTGAVAQFVTALHTVGLHDLELVSNGNTIKINGNSVSGLLDYVIEEDEVYVHSRLLAALMNGTIDWHEKRQEVSIATEHVTGTFNTSNVAIKLMSGKSYIALEQFKQVFTDFNWSVEGETISLSNVRGNE